MCSFISLIHGMDIQMRGLEKGEMKNERVSKSESESESETYFVHSSHSIPSN